MKSSATASVSKWKKIQKGLDGDDDDIDFQDAKSSDTTCRYKPPDLQYMGRKLKIHFRIKDTGKIQWYDGQILNYRYDSSSGQYGVHFLSDQQTIILLMAKMLITGVN